MINASAPNSTAVQNAKGLIKKKKFVKLFKSPDETVIFGECEGSGKDNYAVSVDFIKPENPVYRCTCPSRQFPCKHALGLMYSYIEGFKFAAADIPGDILEKREKAEKRETKNQDAPKAKTAGKVNKSALAKKLKAQIEGLELLEKITNSIITAGFGSLDAKSLKNLNEQEKQLGNSYLPNIQGSLKVFISFFKDHDKKEDIYGKAMNALSTLNAASKKGREYLEKRLEDESLPMDTESIMEEWLGHAWQLSELKECGRILEDTNLLQLSFSTYVSFARQELMDLGRWINLKDGNIYETVNYRPFKAVKYIKEEDSFFSVVKAKELFIYPGDINKRVRWEEMSIRDVTHDDLSSIKSYAKKSYPDVIKSVKNQMKNPLSDKNPAVLVGYSRIGIVNNSYTCEDYSGFRILLKDYKTDIPSCYLLRFMKQKDLHDGALLVSFNHDLDSGVLSAQPLSIVTDTGIIRLIY